MSPFEHLVLLVIPPGPIGPPPSSQTLTLRLRSSSSEEGLPIKLLSTFLVLALLVLAVPAVEASTSVGQFSNSDLSAEVLDIATASADVTVVSTTYITIDGEFFTIATAEVHGVSNGSLADEILIAVPGGYTPEGYQAITSHQPYLAVGDEITVALVDSPHEQVAQQALSRYVDTYTIVGGLDGVSTNLGEFMSQADAAGDFSLTGASFGEFPVSFRVKATNSGLSVSATIEAVRRGFQTWEDDLGSDIDFSYGGTTTAGDNLSDGVNAIYWTTTPNPGHTYLAQASWIATGAGEMIGFDIKFNRDYRWSNGGTRGRFDIGTTTAHEAGHVLGLGHSNTQADVMLSVIQSGAVKPLGPGDKAGVASLYPEPDRDPGRINAVSNILSALQAYVDANGTYRVSGAGWKGKGEGWY